MGTSCRFPPALRLLRPAEFQAVFDGAQYKVGEAGFLLLARANACGHARLGLVIAKKKVRRAVDRNRLKRIVRNSFRLHQADLPATDVIFMARQDLAQRPAPELHAALGQAWKRLRRQVEKARPADSGDQA